MVKSAGKAFLVFGASGSGKSTAVRKFIDARGGAQTEKRGALDLVALGTGRRRVLVPGRYHLDRAPLNMAAYPGLDVFVTRAAKDALMDLIAGASPARPLTLVGEGCAMRTRRTLEAMFAVGMRVEGLFLKVGDSNAGAGRAARRTKKPGRKNVQAAPREAASHRLAQYLADRGCQVRVFDGSAGGAACRRAQRDLVRHLLAVT